MADTKELKQRKNAWMARVMEDIRLTATRRVVLVYCAHQYAGRPGHLLPDGGRIPADMFSVTQETVATKLRLNTDTVSDALHHARELGWLQLVAERQRGRGHRSGDVYRLTFPDEIGGPPSGSSGSSESEIPGRKTGYLR